MDACKDFQDLILTDYTDGELDQASKARVDDHLLNCVQCRALAQEVQQAVTTPFTRAGREPVPERIWDTIKGEIEGRQPWSWSFVFPRLVPAMAGFAMLVLVGSTVLHNQQLRHAQEAEQGQYLSSVLASVDTSADTDGSFSETPIETYFL